MPADHVAAVLFRERSEARCPNIKAAADALQKELGIVIEYNIGLNPTSRLCLRAQNLVPESGIDFVSMSTDQLTEQFLVHAPSLSVELLNTEHCSLYAVH